MQDVEGHTQAQRRLAQAAASGLTAHAYLLTGPDGIGKTTLALAFARLLLCERPDMRSGDACGDCAPCRKIAHGNHPDVRQIELEEGKRLLGIDAIRETVIRLANLAPSEASRRIFILRNVESMTPATVNALLKTLEEPPPGVIFLLTSADAEHVLPTVLSRCQIIALRAFTAHEIAAALQRRWGVGADEARALSAVANGRLGWAVRAHEQPQLREAQAEQLERIIRLTSAPRDERIRAAGALAADADSARQALELWMQWWRDVTLAANGAAHLASEGEARRHAERLGHELGPEAVRA
ncbi:MAG TPA: DNA polymerase III subunit delta', partial [Ktedonobacterales bacterium]|nr:DNA polymerase III subunit delta' [Ktedonobacterales bacterium]